MSNRTIRRSLPLAILLLALALAGGYAATEAAAPPAAALWVEVEDGLWTLDLETGSPIGRVEVAAGSLVADPSGDLPPRWHDGSRSIALAQGGSPSELDGTERWIARDAGGAGWISGGDGRIEGLDDAGRLLWSLALESGDRIVGLGSRGAWVRSGGSVRWLGIETDAPTAPVVLDGLAPIPAACVDPLSGDLVVATAARVVWLSEDGSVRGGAPIAAVRQLVCGRFGTVWALEATAARRLRSQGDVGAEELSIGLDGARAIAADPRDNALLVAFADRIERWGSEGERVWTRRFEREVVTLAAPGSEANVAARRRRREARERTGSDPKSVPTAGLESDEIVLRGRLVDPAGRPVADAEFSVYGREVVRATTDAAGLFETVPMPYLTGDALLAWGTRTSAHGQAQSFPWRSTYTAGTTVELGDDSLDYPCAVDFEDGLFPANDLNGEVRAAVVFDDGSGPALYVGGTFTIARGVTVNRVAKWDGTNWSALGSGLTTSTSPSVDALIVFDDGGGPRLHAGGRFTSSGGATVRYVAKWNGSTWSEVGGNLNSQVLALGVHDAGGGPQLYATGTFTSSGGTTYNRIARLNGSSWAALGSGLNGTGRALASYGGSLYVGGSFTTAGGGSASRIARWNGSSWSAVGSGVTGGSTIQVNALLPWNDGSGELLAVGGRFTTAGGTSANHVATWNGSSWSALASGLGVQVYALAAFDDGWGPTLYAAGSFTTVSGDSFNRIARWGVDPYEGGYWGALGDSSIGTNGNGLALAAGTVDEIAGLFVGGAFTSADGVASSRVARLRRPSSCTDWDWPQVKIVDPSQGETTGDATPPIRIAVPDRGEGADPGTLIVRANGTPITVSCTSDDEILDCDPQQPLAGAITLSATIEDLQGNLSLADSVLFTIADADPPTVAIVEPAEGANVASARPGIRLVYSDAGAGVDTGSIALQWNGSSLDVECQTSPTEAVCVPTAGQAAGAVVLTATVEDLQGNPSPPATRSFALAPPAIPETSVEGTVRFADGHPASGASVWIAGVGTTVTTASDGSFAMPSFPLGTATELALTAKLVQSGTWIGHETVTAIAGGTTIVEIVLAPKCDGRFETLDLVPEGATVTRVRGTLSDAPFVFATFDDGSGPALYLGGAFNYGESGELERIARWTASGWSSVGAGIGNSGSGLQPDVRALAVFEDGTGPALYAGGRFSAAGGSPAGSLARWDGTSWQEVGGGTNDTVMGLAAFDDGTGTALFVSGPFDEVRTRETWHGGAEPIPVGHVARWDGTSWTDVGAGVEPSNPTTAELTLAAFDLPGSDRLLLWDYGQIWEWSSGAWSPLPPLPEFVYVDDVEIFDDGSGATLFLAGGGGVWKLSGGSWTEILEDNASSIAVFDDGGGPDLYVTSTFWSQPGGSGTSQMRRWEGTQWSTPLADGERIATIAAPGGGTALLRLDDENSDPYATFEVVRPMTWQAGAWVAEPVASDVVGTVTSVAIAETPAGEVVLFTGPSRVGALELDGGIYAWDGSSVAAATAGFPAGRAVISAPNGAEPHVYAVDPTNGQVAEWSGTAWVPFGGPLGGPVYDLEWIDLGTGPALYAGAGDLYRWNGVFWHFLGRGGTLVGEIEPYAGRIYTRTHRFDGTTWESWGSGNPTFTEPRTPKSESGNEGLIFEATAAALEARPIEAPASDLSTGSFDKGESPPGPELDLQSPLGSPGGCSDFESFGGLLHAAGTFSSAGGSTHRGYAAWNGSAWTGGSLPAYGLIGNRFLSSTQGSPTVAGSACALEVLDDGSGAKLILGGDFSGYCTSASSCTVTGQRNVQLGGGVDGPSVRALAAGRWRGAPAIAIGGDLGEAGGDRSARIALWVAGSTEEAACSTSGRPPVVTITEPAQPWTSAPSVAIVGRLDEPASLRVGGATIPVGTDLTFTFPSGPLAEGSNRFFLEAVDLAGDATELDYELVRDSSPPTISIEAPADGVRVFTPRPAIDLRFLEAGSGIDPVALSVTVDGTPVGVENCVVREDAARCTPAADLVPGFATIVATIADRAGNVSAPATIEILIDPPGGSTATTLVGTVVFEGGAPAVGARVRVLGRSGAEIWTGADGSFALPLSPVSSDDPIRVVAEATLAGQAQVALSAPVAPVPGGTTPVGVLTLRAACDLAAAPELSRPVGLAGRVLAAAVFDDGSGPALYLGGTGLLTTPSNTSLVRWDGAVFSAVNGATGTVRALAVFDDGSGGALYVGGQFTTLGGQTVNGIAKWDGSGWSALAGGVRLYSKPPGGTCSYASGSVYALAVHDDGSGPALWVGGYFNEAGAGVSSEMVARWDGASWSGLGPPTACFTTNASSIDRTVLDLEVYDEGSGPKLFAAGAFVSIGGVPARNVARLDAGTWAPMSYGIGRWSNGTQIPAMVNALAVFDSGEGPELVAAGLFNRAGDGEADTGSVARWNGERWATLGSGLEINYTTTQIQTGIQALAVHDDGSGLALYAAGKLTGDFGSTYGRIARWNGATWSPLGIGISDPAEGGMTLLSWGDELVVGGGFTDAGGLRVDRGARWTGERWLPFGDGLNGDVRALAIFDDGTGPALVVGGDFTGAAGIVLNRVARWDGSRFWPLGSGTSGPVHALEVFDDGSGPNLFAGGDFDTAGGFTVHSVARWNGSAWSPLGAGVSNGLNQGVWALEGFDDGSGPALYVGGQFDAAGGLTTRGVARWRSGAWESVGGGIASGEVRALKVATVGAVPSLLAGGSFTSIGGVAATGIGSWDGTWHAMGTGLAGTVRAIAPWGENAILAAGDFSGYLKLWNGTAWVNPTGGGTNQKGESISIWDDGRGAAAFVGGTFTSPGARIGRWSGTSWSTLGAGADTGSVLASASFEEPGGSAIYLGGSFTKLDGVASSRFARWARPLHCGDVSGPVITVDSPADGAWLPQQRPEVRFTAEDAGSGVDPDTIVLRLDGAPVASACAVAGPAATCYPDSAWPQGPHLLSVEVDDFAGNTGSHAVSFAIDSIAPQVEFTDPVSGAILTTSTPTFDLTFGDSGSGVDPLSVEIELSGTTSFGLDCTYSVEDGECVASSPIPDARIEIALHVRDLAGNVSIQPPAEFFVDTLAPVIAILEPANASTTYAVPTAVVLTVDEDGSGIDLPSAVASLDGSPLAVSCTLGGGGVECEFESALANGLHEMTISLADRAGQRSATATSVFELTVDAVAPSLAFVSPGPGATIDLQTTPVELAWSDSTAGVAIETFGIWANGQPVSPVCQTTPTGATCTIPQPLSGPIHLEARIADVAGNLAPPATLDVVVPAPGGDVEPPTIEILSPADGAWVRENPIEIVGRISETATLRVDAQPVTVYGDRTFRFHRTLVSGTNVFVLEATDLAGHVGQLNLTLELDDQAPLGLDDGLVTVEPSVGGAAPFAGAAAAVLSTETSISVEARSRATGAAVLVAVAPDRSFSGVAPVLPGDVLELRVVDLAGNASAAVERGIVGTDPAPPVIDPGQVGTDRTSPFCIRYSWLWSGPSPAQLGVASGAIDCSRAAIVRGRVLDEQGVPVEGARVRAPRDPGVGIALTRADGWFDLAVNGGEVVPIEISSEDRLPVRRYPIVAWSRFEVLDDVLLVPRAPAAETVELAAIASMVSVRGPQVSDADGARQATLLIPTSTLATALLATGGTQPLGEITVRATEYTVGDRLDQRLPGPLPERMDPTYVVELSVDEAEALDSTRVEFSQPLSFLVENFAGVPTGAPIASAWWDVEAGRWVPADDGRAIEVLAVVGGRALLDVSGTGEPAGPEELAALAISEDELARIGSLYPAGAKLLRGRVDHFTAWYWGLAAVYAVLDAHGPDRSLPPPSVADERRTESGSIGRFGGWIDGENQILGQSLPVVGAPAALAYASDRVPGRRTSYELVVPLSGEQVPEGLEQIEVTVEIGGRRESRTVPPEPNRTETFDWDGEDAHERKSGRPERWSVRISYVYPAVFAAPEGEDRTFDLPGGLRFEVTARGVRKISREYTGSFPVLDAKSAFGMGGWSLDLVHQYDPMSKTVFYGDGSRRSWASGPEVPNVLSRVAGNFESGGTGDDGPAREAALSFPRGISVTPSGDLLVADPVDCRVRKVLSSGRIVLIAGTSCDEEAPAGTGDGSLAIQAVLRSPRKAVEGPDGSIYVADGDHGRIRRIDPEGAISTFASFDTADCRSTVTDIVVNEEGDVYATSFGVETTHGTSADTECGGVFRISADGTRVRGKKPDHGWAFVSGIDLTSSGRLVVAKTSCVFEYTEFAGEGASLLREPAGACWLYGPGDPTPYDHGDGEPASWATRFYGPNHVAVASDGTIYVADTINRRIRSIGRDGIVRTVAGGGSTISVSDGVRAARAALLWPTGVALSPDDQTLYVADAGGKVIWRMEAPHPDDDGEYEIPSAGGAVIDVFDAEGYHRRTEDGLSRRTLLTFMYEDYPAPDDEGPPVEYVTEIEDEFGSKLTIQRDGAGEATAIVNPFGKVTTLETDPVSGYLSSVSWVGGSGTEQVQLGHGASGLLESLIDPNDGSYEYQWDEKGRLTNIADPANGSVELVSEPVGEEGEPEDGRKVTARSAMDRAAETSIQFPEPGAVDRASKSPAGLDSSSRTLPSGRFEATGPEGTKVVGFTAADPVFGSLLESPYTATVTSPGGRTLSAESSTPALALDASDPLKTLRRTEAVSVGGRTWSTAYDGIAGTLTSTSPAGRLVTTALDAHGRATSVVAAGTEEVRYAYDSRGRLERVEQGEGAGLRSVQYGYDATEGWLVTTTDSLGRTVTFERDPVGQVTKQILPDLREIVFTYDANGNVTSVTPPTRPPHDFYYTPVDQLEVYAPPDVGFTPRATTYDYNDDGQVTTITRPDGQTIVSTYEPSGRLDYVTLPTGTIDLSFDAVGRVQSVTAPGGVGHSFTYDGSIPLSMATTGPVPGSVAFAYDADLRLSSRTINGSSSVSFGYDADGLLTSAGTLSLVRNVESGLLETTTLAGTTDARTRTSFGELDTWTGSVSGTPVYSFDLDRDAAGRITKKTETIGGVTSVWDYAYHPQRGWLTEVRKDSVVVATYGYDDNGNRTSWSDFWGSGTSTYDAQDRQLTAELVDYAYSANGERLTKTAGADVTDYVYDVRGALLEVDLPNGIGIEYVVDASGRRIGRKVDGVLTKGWIYAGGLSPVAETDGSGAITKTFVYATKGNVPDYLVAGGTTYRIFTDHLGSVRLVVDATTGAIAQRIDYDAWGRITLDTNPGFQPFGFAGGIYDHQTGLTRFGARDYDPETGRWTAKDPIGFAGGSAGLYEYVGNDPLNATDPSGLAETWGDRLESLETCHQVVEDTWGGILDDVVEGSGSGTIAGPISGAIVYFATKVFGGIGCEMAHWDVYIRGDLETQAAYGMRMALVAQAGIGNPAAASRAAPGSAAEALHPTFRPGPFARGSIPARSAARDFTSSERAWANGIGKCHTCGSVAPGTKSGNFVLDHQPVSALNLQNLPQRLFPQCLSCSREQGLAVARLMQGKTP